jgi:MFS family permease
VRLRHLSSKLDTSRSRPIRSPEYVLADGIRFTQWGYAARQGDDVLPNVRNQRQPGHGLAKVRFGRGSSIVRHDHAPFGTRPMSIKLWLPPALHSRRVRIYVAGHLVSVIGTWFQTIALGWLVYRLTGSVFLLGAIGFASQLPFLIVSPFAGMAVDRLPRVTLLIIVDCILAGLAFLLSFVAWLGVTNFWVYFALALAVGVANAVETPARQSLFTALVDDRSLLPSVIGISSATFNLGRLIGPAFAGVALLHIPESVCFLANGLSFVAIITALIAMRLPNVALGARADPSKNDPAKTDAVKTEAAKAPSLSAGFDDLRKLAAVRYLLPTMAAVGLFGVAHLPLMPSIASKLFGGGSETVGLLYALSGLGALGASLMFAFARTGRLMVHLVKIAPFALGAGLLLLAMSRSLALGAVAVTMIGWAVMACAATTNTLVQQSVPEALRGRAISLYLMSYNGMGPFGHLLSGAIAEVQGLPVALAVNGAAVLAVAVIGLRRLARDRDAQQDIDRAAGL